MSEMEEKSRKRSKRANLKKAVLTTVKAAGVLSVALVAPNVLGSLAKLGILDTGRRQESIRAAKNRLIRQGLLSAKAGRVLLTEKGQKTLQRMELAHSCLIRRNKWDGKWRVLVFDIPNHRRGLRDRIRLSLKANGFERLQDSVWVLPYNCEDFVSLLKAELRIGKDMQYLIVDSIENDRALLEAFGLN